MNTELTDKGIVQKHYVHLGMAVDTPTGLIVPVIRDADLLRLTELSACATELAARAKGGKLSAPEYTSSSFTVSNLGMFGLECFVPILNTPETGILGVGKIEKEPVAVQDEIVIRAVMRLTLTYDHRVIDGAPAAQFLARVKTISGNPLPAAVIRKAGQGFQQSGASSFYGRSDTCVNTILPCLAADRADILPPSARLSLGKPLP